MTDTADDLPTARAFALVESVLDEVRDGGGSGQGVLTGLEVLRRLREELAAWEPELITAAREQGVSWARIAPALGVTSRQAAERRYLRLRPSSAGEAATGEERVRAERDKRAGDRAVTVWARENSASLRSLAGQVSAVEGLGATAQAHVERVQQALGEDDAAALLAPLAGAHPHLREDHAALADRISSLTKETDQLRQRNRTRQPSPTAGA
jgi:hypothetical protein